MQCEFYTIVFVVQWKLGTIAVVGGPTDIAHACSGKFNVACQKGESSVLAHSIGELIFVCSAMVSASSAVPMAKRTLP